MASCLTLTNPNDAIDAEFGGYSIAGNKTENQDAFAAQRPESAATRRIKGIVACLADGASCSERAQEASQTSVTLFIQDYYSTPESWSIQESGARVINSLNSWLFHNGSQSVNQEKSLVTTFSTVIFKSNTAHILHIGDSRIYRFRDQQLNCITTDHVNNGMNGNSHLTRALGIDHRIEVDYLKKSVKVDDIFVCTSDGVHGFLTDQQLNQLLSEDHPSLEEKAKSIVNRALQNGSNDNLSCLLIRASHVPEHSIEEWHQRLSLLKIPPILQVGNKIDCFEVLQVIHSGARSHVYLVQNRMTKKQFILKAPDERFSDDPQYLEGFSREGWAGRRLNHPQIMQIYSRPDTSPFLYHVCEYIEGQTLRQWMLDNPKPPLETVRKITEQMMKSVRVLQRNGMVHRDLKPENFILDQKGHIHLIDFGTVQIDSLEECTLIADEAPVGSVHYIAPEYFSQTKGSHVSDIFSLGVIIYEMLTGKVPYKSPASREASAYAKLSWNYHSAKQHRKDLPRWLDFTLKKACHPQPNKRYFAMSELLSDLHKPSEATIKQLEAAPLAERNPILLWKSISFILFVILVLQTGYLVTLLQET